MTSRPNKYKYKVKVKYYDHGQVQEIRRIVEANTASNARAVAIRIVNEQMLKKGVSMVISPLRD